MGIEEGGLVQVLSHLYRALFLWGLSSGIGNLIIGCNRFLFRHFCHRHHRHRLIHHHSCSLAHLHAGTHHSPSGEIMPVIRRGIDTVVEATEHQLAFTGVLPVVGGSVGHLITGGERPTAGWQRQVVIGHQRPLMRLQLIETLVIERRHQLGVSRLSLRIEYGECPLLLLTGCQTVAEGGPLQFHFLVGQRSFDLGGMGIALALLHPCKGEQQTVLILILISELAVDQLVASVDRPALNDLLTGKYAIDDMHVGGRRADLDSDGFSVGRELGGRLIEPVIGRGGRCGVVETEHHEVALQGVSLTGGLQRVLAALQFVAEGDRLLCLDLLPLTTVYAVLNLSVEILACGIQQVEGDLGLFVAQHLLRQIDTQGLLAVTERQGAFAMMRLSGCVGDIGTDHKTVEHRMTRLGQIEGYLGLKLALCVGHGHTLIDLYPIMTVA